MYTNSYSDEQIIKKKTYPLKTYKVTSWCINDFVREFYGFEVKLKMINNKYDIMNTENEHCDIAKTYNVHLIETFNEKETKKSWWKPWEWFFQICRTVATAKTIADAPTIDDKS